MSRTLILVFALACGIVTLQIKAPSASAEDYYVSAANGKGKKGTLEKPAKDIGNLAKKLQPGDTVHIAGGVYRGRGDCGTFTINVPISIIGGYDETFTTRDPWGETRTVFTGTNGSDNWKREPAIYMDLNKYRGPETFDIVIDGVIVDHAERNRYSTDAQQKIVRMANPRGGQNPTPESGGIAVRTSKVNGSSTWNIAIRNCIVMNTAPTQGALSVTTHKSGQVTIENNLVINNTGTGIQVGSTYLGTEKELRPTFNVTGNTVLFTWKHEPITQSFSGNSFGTLDNVVVNASNNFFGFADRYGIYNERQVPLLLTNNLILANVAGDYLEFDTRIDLDDIEDEAEHIHEDSEGNVNDSVELPVSEEWATSYGSRVLIDRNAMEADIEAQKTTVNELRSILGLPLQAGTIEGPEVAVWLNRMSIDNAIEIGTARYLDAYGCQKPEATGSE